MLHLIKNVFVGLTEEGQDAPSSALSYGLSLAQAADAHLTVQAASVKLIIPGAAVSAAAMALVQAENRRLRALAGQVAARARNEAGFEGVSCSVATSQLTYSDLRDALLKQARVHDLCILDAEERASAVDRGFIENILFGSGRPVLVVPPGHDSFSARRLIVAWDGGAAAARAVADAMPFLRAAEAVEVVSVVGEKDLSNSVEGSDLTLHLARHGINVELKILPVEDGGVAATLRDQANLYRADLLITGAFKHSRLREWVLGGVTQSLLKSCPVPLLMSH